jgi:hypothetical protein
LVELGVIEVVLVEVLVGLKHWFDAFAVVVL